MDEVPALPAMNAPPSTPARARALAKRLKILPAGIEQPPPPVYIRYSQIANIMPRPKSNPQLVLRPQDLVVALRLSLSTGPAPAYALLAAELGLTASEAHAAVERGLAAQLIHKDTNGKPTVIRAALCAFLQHGARYCFPATRDTLTRGMPTGYAAAPLRDLIRAGTEPVPVWPSQHGTVRGVTLYPLYPSVPEAANKNPALYEMLALFDAIRAGSARERALAIDLLEQRLIAAPAPNEPK